MKKTMHRSARQAITTLAVLAALSVVSAQAQEGATLLRWRNGDVLPGIPLESKSGQVRWSSPRFLDVLTVDDRALESVIFSGNPVFPSEAFRVGTVSGDVWAADLIGSDETSFLFSSRRFGEVRVNRDAVYSIERRVHPNLVFDGSQFSAWTLSQDGPIRDLTYKVYEGHWTPGYPDFLNQSPLAEGRLAAGYVDIRLTDLTDLFGIVFEGLIETTVEGEYTFEILVDDQARMSIDGKRIISTENRGNGSAKVKLGVGSHSFHLDYLEYGSSERLGVWWTGPNFSRQPLFGTNQVSGWRRGLGGFAETRRRQADIYWAIELPRQFELDVDIEATAGPRFVLALGKDRSNAGASSDSLRLETWDNELVVVQDKVFEPVMTIDEGQRDVRLRLVFDGEANELRVFDSTGSLLVEVEGIHLNSGESGIYLRNRGEDLTIRRLSVHGPSKEVIAQTFDPRKPRVHLSDGQVVQGRLFLDSAGAQVIDEVGSGHRIELTQVTRLVWPDRALMSPADVAALSYVDGAVVHGEIEQLNSDQAILRTEFSETPVGCALAGASLLRFGWPAVSSEGEAHARDELFSEHGRLLGRLSFDSGLAPLSWQPEGAAKSLRVGHMGAFRLELNPERISREPSFDAHEFSQVLHLKNGEVLPCQITAYDENTLGFQSPYILGQTMDSAQVKGIEFGALQSPAPIDEPSSSNRASDRLREATASGSKSALTIDPDKLERALTVPRFSRENPPSHVLVAKTGDLKRGELLRINGNTIQFESKLRELTVPIDRMAQVVNVSQPEADLDPSVNQLRSVEGEVRAKLADGSILVFEPLASTEGRLVGRSSIYGEVAIPIASIQRLTFGGFEEEPPSSRYEEWVVRPAREPEFPEQTGGVMNAEDVKRFIP